MTLVQARQGFSIMETLVAIAILALTILPLYSFQQTLADTAARLQSAASLMTAQESALAVLQSIDPVSQPSGEMQLGEWRLTWESRELAAERPADGYLGTSIWGVGLYEITARLESGDRSQQFSIRQVGWEQVRDPLQF